MDAEELYVLCLECDGSGLIIDSHGESVTCPACEGTGSVLLEDQDYYQALDRYDDEYKLRSESEE